MTCFFKRQKLTSSSVHTLYCSNPTPLRISIDRFLYLKKGAVFVISDKIKTEMSKTHLLKDKIGNQNIVKNKKHSTLGDWTFVAWSQVNHSIRYSTAFIFTRYSLLLQEYNALEIKLGIFVTIRWRPEVTVDLQIYKGHCGNKLPIIVENFYL